MAISRRNMLGCTAVSLMGLAGLNGPALAQERSFAESYRSITPQPSPNDKIEVLDFFWYGCPYCYQLMPLMAEWEKTKPQDVIVRRIPAVLRQEWVPDAHLFYTMELLGVAEQLHARIFEAYHRDRLQGTDQEAVAKWAVANGVDRAKWDEVFASKEVRDRVVRAVETARDYDVRGTPVVIVDGRWQTGGGLAGSLKNVMPTVDGLINLARARRIKA